MAKTMYQQNGQLNDDVKKIFCKFDSQVSKVFNELADLGYSVYEIRDLLVSVSHNISTIQNVIRSSE